LSDFFPEKKGNIFLFVTVIILSAVSIYPLINSPYLSDDVINSFIKGALLLKNQSIWQFIFEYIKLWLGYTGRFYPLSYYSAFLFLFLNNLYYYKVIVFIVVLSNLFTFSYFIKITTKSYHLAALSFFIPTIFFQFRFYHDPILSFSFLLPLIFLYLFVSLIFLVLYLQKEKKIFLILSLLVYTISLFTYEISYPFFLIYFPVVYYFSKKRPRLKNIKLASLFILPVGFTSLITLFIARGYYKVLFSGGLKTGTYVPHFRFSAYFLTLAKQIFAAFPLSYYVVDPNKIFEPSIKYLNKVSLSWVFIALVGLSIFFCISFRIPKEISDSSGNFSAKSFMIIGLMLLILPSVLISFSTKYQQEVFWGVAYIPVYISYFGMSLISIGFIYLLYQKFRVDHKYLFSISATLIAIFLLVVASVNYGNNVRVVELLNLSWKYPRENIEAAMQRGLFKSVLNGSYLIVDSARAYEAPAFYFMHSGVRLKFVKLKGDFIGSNLPAGSFRGEDSNGNSLYDFSHSNVYFLTYYATSSQNGYSILGKIKRMTANKDTINKLTLEKLKIYISLPRKSNNNYTYSSELSNKVVYTSLQTLGYKEPKMRIINTGEGWKLYEVLE